MANFFKGQDKSYNEERIIVERKRAKLNFLEVAGLLVELVESVISRDLLKIKEKERKSNEFIKAVLQF